MGEPEVSNWEAGARKGPRPLVLLAGVVLIVVASYAVVAIWLISFVNSPGQRVARQIYDDAPNIINRASYQSFPVDTLTIVVARDVTREEAFDLRCGVVVPMLTLEHLSPQIIIKHPDDDFVLNGTACPPP